MAYNPFIASENRRMIELTTGQQQALDSANHSPPIVIDQRTAATYVLVRTSASAPESVTSEIPEGIRRSRAAFRQALPELLARRRDRNKWVCYHLEEWIGIGNDYAALIEVCNLRNIPNGEVIIERITPCVGSEEEEELERREV